MDVLKKLNQPVLDKPYHGFPKLSIGYHRILGFRESIGKYGKSVIAELKDEIIFLPTYLSNRIVGSDVDKLNSCEEPVYLYFGGRNKEKRYATLNELYFLYIILSFFISLSI